MEDKDLKEAIKDKLYELNKYSDGLPDYISLMVVNNKPKEFIERDLEIFLREHCRTFVNWISDYIMTSKNKVNQSVSTPPQIITNEIEMVLVNQPNKANTQKNQPEFNENKRRNFKKLFQQATSSDNVQNLSKAKENLPLNQNINISTSVTQPNSEVSFNAKVGKPPRGRANKAATTKYPKHDLRNKLIKKRNIKQKLAMKAPALSEQPKEVVFKTVNFDSINTVAQTDVVAANIPTTPAPRCKFWPNCKNQNNCPFSHPTIPCRDFPACLRGKNCAFIHPRCKFNSKCLKADCPYYHDELENNKSTTPSTVPCHFGLKCTNKNCSYLHPNTSVNNNPLKYVAPHLLQNTNGLNQANTTSIPAVVNTIDPTIPLYYQQL